MTLGAVLVLVGTIFCFISIFSGYYANNTRVAGWAAAPLLAVGATLIGVGVLVGNAQLSAH